MTRDDVLVNLRKLIGEEFNSDDIICAFEDFEENGETEVCVKKSSGNYLAYINSAESTLFVISVKRFFDDAHALQKEIIQSAWIV